MSSARILIFALQQALSSAPAQAVEIELSGLDVLAEMLGPDTPPDAFHPIFRKRITEKATQALEAAEGEQGHTLRIKVTMSDLGEYDIRVTPLADGKPLQEVSTSCHNCVPDDVFTVLAQQVLPEATARFASTPAPSEPPPSPSEVSPSIPPETEVPTSEPHRSSDPPPVAPVSPRGGFGGLGIAGVVVGAVGVGALSFGAIRLGLDGRQTEFAQTTEIEHHSSPATNASLGLGAVAIATGVSMILVDQLVCRRRPQGCRRLKSRASLTQGKLHF